MLRLLCCAAILLACSPSAALARSSRQADDTREIQAYRLTREALNKVVAVNRVVVQAMLKDPKVQQSIRLRQELDALQAKDDRSEADEKRIDEIDAELEQLGDDVFDPLGGEAQSLAEMEARIRKYPPLVQALEREGMTPREYATFWLAFVQAAFVHGFQKSGMLKELPPGVSPENVGFIADHAEEIEALQKEFEALGRPQP